MPLVGNAPIDLGLVDVADGEMLFSMYLPISVPDSLSYHLPEHLKRFAPLVSRAKQDSPMLFGFWYVYLTAKTLWVEDRYIGNRPGWHSDGFGTEDINYIWSDRAPTEFLIVTAGGPWDVSDDCDLSMRQMEEIGRNPCPYQGRLVTYPNRHLLKLTPAVAHRSPVKFEPGLRTFAKVSLSPNRYDLKGNAVNHLLPETHWPLVDRQVKRNHPSSEAL